MPKRVSTLHWIRRAYYAYPLAQRWREFLRGKIENPMPLSLPEEELSAYWRERWLKARAQKN